jgi:hypothetical protein
MHVRGRLSALHFFTLLRGDFSAAVTANNPSVFLHPHFISAAKQLLGKEILHLVHPRFRTRIVSFAVFVVN